MGFSLATTRFHSTGTSSLVIGRQQMIFEFHSPGQAPNVTSSLCEWQVVCSLVKFFTFINCKMHTFDLLIVKGHTLRLLIVKCVSYDY